MSIAVVISWSATVAVKKQWALSPRNWPCSSNRTWAAVVMTLSASVNCPAPRASPQ